MRLSVSRQRHHRAILRRDYTDGPVRDFTAGAVKKLARRCCAKPKVCILLAEADGEYAGAGYEKFTISPSYSFSDNVFGLVEFSSEELDGVEQDTAAVELIYSF